MENNVYEGISKNGNLQEALDNAIVSAKEKLIATYIKWEFQTAFGKDGGIALESELTVRINAQAI